MKLLNLELENFKGIRKFELSPAGLDVSVYGDNATGKTTLFDSMLWLLFGKDSLNRSDFEIKTLDSEGKMIPMLDHRVSGDFMLDDGRTVNLTRVYKEKYERKRGSSVQEMTGHTTDFFIDGVPKLAKEYKAFVDSIAIEDIFKLITNPLYFNEQLSPDARRRMLMEVCGEVSDEEIIASNTELSELLGILNGRSIDEYKKIIASRKTSINKELEIIPARIDEINKGMADADSLDETTLKAEQNLLSKRITEALERKTLAKNGNGILETKAELMALNNKISELEFNTDREWRKQTEDQSALTKELELKAKTLKSQELACMQQANDMKHRLEEDEKELKGLEEKFKELNASEFNGTLSDTCPTCNQKLPVAEVETIKAKALAEFNLDKAKRLEGLQKLINSCNNRISEKRATIVSFVEAFDGYQDDYGAVELLLAQANETLEKLKASKPIYGSEHEALIAKRFELEFTISIGGSSVEEEVKAIDEEISNLQSLKQETDLKLSKIEANKAHKLRIKELEDNQRKLSEEFQNLEKETFLIEEFIKTKVSVLESSINKHFKIARFKMFDIQVNGGIKEVCDTTYNGVPFRSMNNAARINVGLDIINALTKHYKVSAPVFIDNAEAVTEFEPCDSQVIKLFVSENDKELRIGG